SGQGNKDTPLTKELFHLLQQQTVAQESHIRFITLNQRSLVGGITANGTAIQTSFLESLLDQLYGGEKAREIWAPCQSCSAKERCEVFRATRIFGPAGLPGAAEKSTCV